MKTAKIRILWTALSCGLALLFGVYVLLDTFLLARVEGSAQGENLSLFAAETAAGTQTESGIPETAAGTGTESGILGAAAGTQTESGASEQPAETQTDAAAWQITEQTTENLVYSDENVSIALNQYRVYDTDVYVAEVWLSSARYLKTALAQNSYGKNVTAKTSEMAAENGAILAINGDYYGAKESGYVIRNGVVYRDYDSSDTDVLCVYADGSFAVTNSAEYSAQELAEQGVWQAFSFGPGLVEDGEITVTEEDEVGKAKASNPRTAIGWIDGLHYVFVVSDGRTAQSEGLSLYQLASFLRELGVQTAYNLDGGGSSTMVLNGEIINNPTTGGSRAKERSVSDIVYIAGT